MTILIALSAIASAPGALAQTTPPPAVPFTPAAPGTWGGPDDARIVTRDQAAAEADARFARLDTDHDGVLTPEERRAGRAAMRPRGDRPTSPPSGRDAPRTPPPPPGARDGGPDGGRSITAADYRDRALRRFDRDDADHDGRIDQAERRAARDRMHDRMRQARGETGGDMPPPPHDD